MTDAAGARSRILAGIRRALGRDEPSPEARAVVEARLSGHPRGPVPARGNLPPARQIELFIQMATEVAATVERVSSPVRVPHAIADYLVRHNLPAELRVAPDPQLDAVPWDKRPVLNVSRGRARDQDLTGVTAAFAGIAETGTLMVVSGAQHPSTLNLMPDNHIVVLRADRVVGCYEDAWDRLRAATGGSLPRTVLFVTGPSRTGDIEQVIQLGAHGPRRLHIVIVESGVTEGAP